MTVNCSLVVSALLASEHDQVDGVIGLVEAYRHATDATRRLNGRRRREALDTARICEAMLIEHLMENSQLLRILIDAANNGRNAPSGRPRVLAGVAGWQVRRLCWRDRQRPFSAAPLTTAYAFCCI